MMRAAALLDGRGGCELEDLKARSVAVVLCSGSRRAFAPGSAFDDGVQGPRSRARPNE